MLFFFNHQNFVTGLNMNEEFWIGLRTIEDRNTSTAYKWEWVDGTLLTTT